MFVFSRWWTYLRNIMRRFTLIIAYFPGAPNENIVQNHLNLELLNVF